MYRFVSGITLHSQNRRAFHGGRIFLDLDGRCNSGNDFRKNDSIVGEFLKGMLRDSNLAHSGKCLYLLKYFAHACLETR